ncbi:enoyl-CoA hydratase [Pseudonocardia thermophila]|jgi:Enoyl-CoA hydratase/carnithine racemase|uniref:Enoyl-CoA hydratase n=1 Tax=Pseudonocardia thermophila TaxID=1848 RepID=A0A1M6XP08_PSETH|nr:enoyl-CoA hydratase-related protein [Pseudonocardia thermophila]SHL07618.1 enoyl-CoA hydratase [Pseudonocardia thermophila]
MTVQVEYTEDGRVGVIALNAPERLNAISEEMKADLYRALDAFEQSTRARVAILRGNGRAFCSGFDLSRKRGQHRGADRDIWSDRQRLRGHAEMFLRLWDCPKPVIAQVHGVCMAGGVQLPMCCDVVVVSEDCRIGWPKLPTGGGWISPMFSLLVGPHRAKQMAMVAGSEITGRTAAEWGYANLAVPADELQKTVWGLATDMARMAPSVLQLKKAAINRVWDRIGFRDTVLAGVEWDAMVHKDASSEVLRGWLREHGMKAAIARFQTEGIPDGDEAEQAGGQADDQH